MGFRLGLCALALASVAATGCTSYRAVSGPLPATLMRPQTVRVTIAYGAKIVMHSARIVGDSLVGVDPWGPTPGAGPGAPARTVAVALADVRRVEVERFDGQKTVVWVLLGAGAFVAYAAWDLSTNGLDLDIRF